MCKSILPALSFLFAVPGCAPSGPGTAGLGQVPADKAWSSFSQCGTTSVTIDVPADYATIQGALTAAVAGDVICVAAGTWSEDIDFGGVDVILHGEDRTTTTISGTGTGPVVTASNLTSAAQLGGFTITGGGGSSGGAGVYASSSDLGFTHLTVQGNHASHSGQLKGGGMFLTNSDSELSVVQILGNSLAVTNNATAYGAGLYIGTGSDVVLDSVTIAYNTSTSAGDAGGGGLYCLKSDLDGDVVQLVGNTVTASATSYEAYGAGAFLADCRTVLDQAIVVDNSASGDFAQGGGIYQAFKALTLSDSVIGLNTATGLTDSQGGGVHTAYNGTLTLDHVDLLANTASTAGSGASEGGGLWIKKESKLWVTESIVDDNTATDGAGMYALNNSAGTYLQSVNLYGNTGTTVLNGVTAATSAWALDPAYTTYATTGSAAGSWDLTVGDATLSTADAGGAPLGSGLAL